MRIPRLFQLLLPILLVVVVFCVPDPKRKSGSGYSPFVSVHKPPRPVVRPKPFKYPFPRGFSTTTSIDWKLFETEAAKATPTIVLDVGTLPETQGWKRLHCTFTGPLPEADIASLTDVAVGSGAVRFDSMGFSAFRTTSVYNRMVSLPASHAMQVKARVTVSAANMVGKPLSGDRKASSIRDRLQAQRGQTGFALGAAGNGSHGKVCFGIATATISETLGVVIARGDYTRPTELVFQLLPTGNWRLLIDGKSVMSGAGNIFRSEVGLLIGDWNDGMQITADLHAYECKVFPCSVTFRETTGPLMDHSSILRHIEKIQSDARARAELRKRGLASGSPFIRTAPASAAATVPLASPAVTIFLPPSGGSIVATAASGDDFALPEDQP